MDRIQQMSGCHLEIIFYFDCRGYNMPVVTTVRLVLRFCGVVVPQS